MGRSSGFADRARSGRRDDSRDPKVDPMVGGESSNIFWYDLRLQMSAGFARCRTEYLIYLMTASAAKLEAQQILRIIASFVASLIRPRYGLSFPASDLWKFARSESRRAASNVNCSVSGHVMIYRSMAHGQGTKRIELGYVDVQSLCKERNHDEGSKLPD